MKGNKQKIKMYLTIGLIMIIIVTAWILNLKNNFNHNDTEQDNIQSLELREKWQQMSTDLSKLLSNIKELQESLKQSPTSSTSQLQAAAEISPEQLDEAIERLKSATTTASTEDLQLPTSTEEIN
jgi:predicted negative regulator of RcsB-dependent stress response